MAVKTSAPVSWLGSVFGLLIVPGLGSARPDGPVVNSPEVKADRVVVFRLFAPKAERVGLVDMTGDGRPRAMVKGDNGVWELAVGPVEPGTYRYLFVADGVFTADPRNAAVSEGNSNTWSVVRVPGCELSDQADVPHGAVARVAYRSSVLNRDRRMHVYTPPGYETGAESYPVLYLLHGAGDSDDSWTSVGRANFILDNLIAAKKAKPMVVVMPFGHTGPFSWIMPTERRPEGGPSGNAKFEMEFHADVRPYVERHYRVKADGANRAIAGLSMGGDQTLNIFGARPHDFAYVGVFGSGIMFRSHDDWQDDNKALFGDDSLKNGKLLWFATGSRDPLLRRTKETVEMFDRNGWKPVFRETEGGHTWANWRKYLNEFAPLLFRRQSAAAPGGVAPVRNVSGKLEK